jgi:hypothetical protein
LATGSFLVALTAVSIVGFAVAGPVTLVKLRSVPVEQCLNLESAEKSRRLAKLSMK